MALINRYDPFREALSLRDAMDRLFQESYVRPATLGTAGIPVDLHENEQGYTLEVSLPGWKPEDVNITFQDGTLTLSGQRTEEAEPEQNGKTWHLRERKFASFSRSFTFPSMVDADKAAASYDNGVLTLTLPKAESAKPRQIKIGPAAKPGPAK